jgi:hypothetical protein
MRKTKPTYISNVSVATKTENRKGATRNHQPSFAAESPVKGPLTSKNQDRRKRNRAREKKHQRKEASV